jgi:hypothetical protein
LFSLTYKSLLLCYEGLTLGKERSTKSGLIHGVRKTEQLLCALGILY